MRDADIKNAQTFGATARHVGRVSTVAFTLGVGAAVITGFGTGVASADPHDTSGAGGSASSAGGSASGAGAGVLRACTRFLLVFRLRKTVSNPRRR